MFYSGLTGMAPPNLRCYVAITGDHPPPNVLVESFVGRGHYPDMFNTSPQWRKLKNLEIARNGVPKKLWETTPNVFSFHLL